MFLTRSEYDRGVNTFSPEGRLFQIEYAIEAIKLGSTAIGISTSEGVVLAVEKRITSPLMEPTTIEKIVQVDEHIACAVSGLMADSRLLRFYLFYNGFATLYHNFLLCHFSGLFWIEHVSNVKITGLFMMKE